MSEPAIDLDTLPELDFARYAPQKRHELVLVQPPVLPAPKKPKLPPGELEIIGQHLIGAFALIWQCIRTALIIIWRRALLRAALLYHRIAQSTYIAWAAAGLGWGGFLAYPVIIHFMR